MSRSRGPTRYKSKDIMTIPLAPALHIATTLDAKATGDFLAIRGRLMMPLPFWIVCGVIAGAIA